MKAEEDRVSSRDATRPELWVCFGPPPAQPPAKTRVVSFMPPDFEADWAARLATCFVSGRQMAHEVRDEARAEYLELIRRIGATPIRGRTLRQALEGPDGCSRWWYLKTSEKNSLWDGDPYATVIRLICVKRIADRYGVKRIRLHGAPADWPAILSGAFEVSSTEADSVGPWLKLIKTVVRGLLARAALLGFYLKLWWVLKRLPARDPGELDVLLQGHWDWSVRPGPDGKLCDGYFSDLPEQLRRRGLHVGWLGWCEPDTAVWQRGRALRRVIAGALPYREVVLAERYLSPGEIVSAALDLRYLWRFLRFEREPAFRELFRIEGLDLYVLLRRTLIDLLAGSSVCRWTLLSTATQRVCRGLKPKLVLTFLELFLHSRAIYAGARLASRRIGVWTAQHASYCLDKTFGLLDRERELRGEPDGCPVPAPDGIFVMGELAARIWRGNGFPEGRVIVTGGLRYRHVRVEDRVRTPQTPLVVLLGASMLGDDELDLCGAAVAAARGLPIQLRLRDHPLYCLSERSGFVPFRELIEVTRGSAEHDLDAADLLLFTHSGLAEEALARGLPVWQWLGSCLNTSVFLELPVVPRFSSVRALRQALESFVDDPKIHRPPLEVRESVVRQCFGPDPGRASVLIADKITELVRMEVPGMGCR